MRSIDKTKLLWIYTIAICSVKQQQTHRVACGTTKTFKFEARAYVNFIYAWPIKITLPKITDLCQFYQLSLVYLTAYSKMKLHVLTLILWCLSVLYLTEEYQVLEFSLLATWILAQCLSKSPRLCPSIQAFKNKHMYMSMVFAIRKNR